MAYDLYTTAVLNRVVDELDRPQSFLLDTFFPTVETSRTEEIWFDVAASKPRLAPFVSPLVEGQIVESLGYTTYSLKPAYIKDKRVMNDGRPFRRVAGAQIGGDADEAAKRRAAIAMELRDQTAMLTRRMEWMAAEALRTGGYTISGEKYQTVALSFGRDAALTVTLAGAARWNDASPDPIGNLETWAGLIRDKSGAEAVDVVMANDVWASFRKHADVKALLDYGRSRSPSTTVDLGPQSQIRGATNMGRVGAFNVWVYYDTYTDSAGATQKFLPDNYLLMVSRDLEGVRHYGAIRDEEAGFQAREFFAKSWTEPDPAVRYMLLQSAPLVVPYRVNAALSAKVQ